MENESQFDQTMRERVSRAISELQSEGSLSGTIDVGKVDCKIDEDEERHFARCHLSLTTPDGNVHEIPLRVEQRDDSQSIREIKQQPLDSLPQIVITSEN